MYSIEYHKDAIKDLKKLNKSNLLDKILILMEILENNPWQDYPPFKRLTHNLEGLCSRRTNSQHRLVYQAFEKEKIVKIYRMWSHYGDN